MHIFQDKDYWEEDSELLFGCIAPPLFLVLLSFSLSTASGLCLSFANEKSNTWILLTDLSLSATQARVFLLAGFA
jgi:hypothetical protein